MIKHSCSAHWLHTSLCICKYYKTILEIKISTVRYFRSVPKKGAISLEANKSFLMNVTIKNMIIYTISVILLCIYCINNYITENSVLNFYQLKSDIISFMYLQGYNQLKKNWKSLLYNTSLI